MFTLPRTTALYHVTLLRHGESQGNFEGRHQGQADFPLTERGREQARALVNRWKSEKKEFELVISSPLARAQETAEIIAHGLNLPLELDPVWMERNNGLMAGLNPEEVRQRLPQPAFIHPYLAVGQTGESQWQLYLRAGAAVQSLFERPPGKYLVVSHGGLLNMFFYAILGITPQPNFHGPRFRFNNSAFATVSYNPTSHHWYIIGVNDHLHAKTAEE
ncbi:MAG: histidine phosphatase family protein [Anaerolineae bacterium]|nr:histidine phosphatase family protein [Anaerolineae bacterium]